MSSDDLRDRIYAVLTQYGRLGVDTAQLRPEDDLYQAGLTSHASVNVMIALEDAFDVEFPPQMLTKATFDSVASIQRALTVIIPATVG